MQKLKIGDKFYYTGDMANHAGFGVITARHNQFIDAKLDDGRVLKGIYTAMFEEGSGQRFKLIDQYNAERAKALNG